MEGLEKDRNDLTGEKLELQKVITQLGLDVNDVNNQTQVLLSKIDQNELELLTLKQRLEESTNQNSKLKDEGKVLDAKLNELTQQFETSRNDKNNLLKKLQRLEDAINQLKKKIDEEILNCKKEYDLRSSVEQELREKKHN